MPRSASPDIQILDYYCLEYGHTVNEKRVHMVSADRFFSAVATGGAPICPVCQRGVSALGVDEPGVYPPAIFALAERGV